MGFDLSYTDVLIKNVIGDGEVLNNLYSLRLRITDSYRDDVQTLGLLLRTFPYLGPSPQKPVL